MEPQRWQRLSRACLPLSAPLKYTCPTLPLLLPPPPPLLQYAEEEEEEEEEE
jgi:hypothetical protein